MDILYIGVKEQKKKKECCAHAIQQFFLKRDAGRSKIISKSLNMKYIKFKRLPTTYISTTLNWLSADDTVWYFYFRYSA